MTTTPEPQDDWMALADAVGITAPGGQPHPEMDAKILIHPSIRHEFTDDTLATMLADWSWAGAGVYPPDLPVDLVPVLDHYGCEGDDCQAVICMCKTGPCKDTVEQACSHHELLCDQHRLDCTQCLDDFRSDGGL